MALTLAAQVSPKGAAYGVKDPGVSAPVVTERVEPSYSDDAREARISGQVTLTAVVSADGKAEEIAVKTPLYPSLDANAVKALSTWRFEPGRKDGEPVRVKVTVEFNFRRG